MSATTDRGSKASPAITTRKDTGHDRWLKRLPLLPALFFVIVMTQVPFLVTLWYSFQSWNLLRPGSKHFVGLANYQSVFSQPNLRTIAWNTVQMTTASVIVSVLLGLAFALLLDRKFVGRGVARTLLISPFLVMPAASALIWKTSMLHPVYGLVNFLLRPLGIGDFDWVNQLPMVSIVTVTVWQWTPFMLLILLAGLQSQDENVREAALVDGAGPFTVFRYLTLPHLRPYIELAILLGSIFIVQTFDPIFMLTQGGPGQATTNIPYSLYLEVFRAFEIGQASAFGVVLVIATIILATLALRVASTLFRESG